MAETGSLEQIEGSIIDNKYIIDALMGEGGMGKVFRVKHLQLGKTFALKLLHFDRMEMEPTLIAKFKREAKTMATIDHPNVVMITDYGVASENYPYIVMEFIEGITLRKYLEQYGKLDEPEVIHIAKQICAGLHEAHKQGIIHRDLKPENIMLRRLDSGELIVRVLDFGIAKVIAKKETFSDSNTMMQKFDDDDQAGTLKYMAYEQAMGEPVDARTDVYAICVIIYEMLTGIIPSLFKSGVENLHKLRPIVSKELSDIVHRGLSQSKDDRPQSALELRQELESVEQQRLQMAPNRPVVATGNLNLPATPVVHNTDEITGSILLKNPQIISSRSGSGKKFWAMVAVFLLLASATVAVVPGLRAKVMGMIYGEKVKPLPEWVLPNMIKVKGGNTMLGTNKGQDEFARPEHNYSVQPFKVSQFLVTNRQYAEFVKETGRAKPAHWAGDLPSPELLEKPVVNVTWHDARAYCHWLSDRTAKNYRLLSEQEWEFLARNQNQYNVSELMGDLLEWTGTAFYLYPDATVTTPKWDRNESVRIFRGKSEESVSDPVTFRLFQYETHANKDLSFRVAADATE